MQLSFRSVAVVVLLCAVCLHCITQAFKIRSLSSRLSRHETISELSSLSLKQGEFRLSLRDVRASGDFHAFEVSAQSRVPFNASLIGNRGSSFGVIRSVKQRESSYETARFFCIFDYLRSAKKLKYGAMGYVETDVQKGFQLEAELNVSELVEIASGATGEIESPALFEFNGESFVLRIDL